MKVLWWRTWLVVTGVGAALLGVLTFDRPKSIACNPVPKSSGATWWIDDYGEDCVPSERALEEYLTAAARSKDASHG